MQGRQPRQDRRRGRADRRAVRGRSPQVGSPERLLPPVRAGRSAPQSRRAQADAASAGPKARRFAAAGERVGRRRGMELSGAPAEAAGRLLLDGETPVTRMILTFGWVSALAEGAKESFSPVGSVTSRAALGWAGR